jgi:hypothetical protein
MDFPHAAAQHNATGSPNVWRRILIARQGADQGNGLVAVEATAPRVHAQFLYPA